MPVKNVAPWISDCIDSVLNQSFSSFNIYVVNDHSTDSTVSIMKQYALKDDRVQLLNNPGNGIIDALSFAFHQSKELLITRMDGDDVMPKNKLELFVKAFKNHPDSIVSGKVNYFGIEPISEGYITYQNWLNKRIEQNDFNKWKYRECVIASANWLTSRKQIEKIGGFSALSYPEDYDMVLKWLSHNISIVGIDAVTHWWREHPKRTSRNSSHYQQPAFFKLKIDHWIHYNYNSNRTVYLIGKGKKQQLVTEILENNSIQHHILERHRYSEIELTNILKNQKEAQLLVCIYPPKKPRMQLESWLKSCGYVFGTDCWYV